MYKSTKLTFHGLVWLESVLRGEESFRKENDCKPDSTDTDKFNSLMVPHRLHFDRSNGLESIAIYAVKA